MINFLFFLCLGLVGLASWLILKKHDAKEREIIEKYNKWKRENGLR